MTLCPSTISDSMHTITCSLPLGHDDDHGRGFLRWDDTGAWHARRYRAENGTWHALPYPEGKPW